MSGSVTVGDESTSGSALGRITRSGAPGADPTAANAHHQLGCLLAKRVDGVGAEESFRDACRCDPKHAGARTGLGHLVGVAYRVQ